MSGGTMSEQQVLPPYNKTEADWAAAREEYKDCPIQGWTLQARAECIARERQLSTALASLTQSEAERERLKGEVAEMTKDRDLWQEAHNDDCPNKAMADSLHAELARERELHQELRKVTLMEALKAVENERLEAHEERLREANDIMAYRSEHGEDAAYSLAIDDAEEAIKHLLTPSPTK